MTERSWRAARPTVALIIAKFLGITVAATLISTALVNVYESRTAASKTREAAVRELAETVTSANTSARILLTDNAPASYLHKRCGRGLAARESGNSETESACDKSLTEALLQEQELGNQRRQDLSKLLVLAEVAQGQFGGHTAHAIRRLENGVRQLGRLTASNSPETRRGLVDELVRDDRVELDADQQSELVNAVSQDRGGNWDVVLNNEFLDAYRVTERGIAMLASKATRSIRMAHVEGQDETFTAAFLDSVTDPFMGIVLVLALLALGLACFWWVQSSDDESVSLGDVPAAPAGSDPPQEQ